MSRANSNQEELPYIKRMVGVDVQERYIYQFLDKKTKEVLPTPETNLIESSGVNHKAIGTLKLGNIPGLSYVDPSQERHLAWTVRPLRALPVGTLYIPVQTRHSGAKRGDWITIEIDGKEVTKKENEFLEEVISKVKVLIDEDKVDQESFGFVIPALRVRK